MTTRVDQEDAAAPYTPPKRKLTVQEYHRLGAGNFFRPDERVELLDGELYTMPPIGDGHIGDVNRLTYLFVRRLDTRAVISVQNPIRLDDYSEPEPDIAVLRPRPDFYSTRKALPPDVFLLIKVAESSLAYDRRTKLVRYALAGIVEVWIVNLVDDLIEVYREPAGDSYSSRSDHRRGESVTPLAFADLTLRVEEVLG